MSNTPINTVVFDLGGVLIDWNPDYLYRRVFPDEKERSWFLSTVCTLDWNEEQDAGRTLKEATEGLVKKFPEHESPIRAYYDRWEEGIRKPYPEVYRKLIDRFSIRPEQAVYVDDNLRNVIPARELGFHGIHFQSPEQFRKGLTELGVL